MKELFRIVGLILIAVMGLSLTACGGDDDDGGSGSGGAANYTSEEIVEMLTRKWNVYGHAKAVVDDYVLFDSDYTGTIEFTKDQKAKAKSSVWNEDKLDEDYTNEITLANFIDDYHKYKIIRKNGSPYISFGFEDHIRDYKIVSLTKTSFKLVLNEDYQRVDINGNPYTNHLEITIISQ